MVKVMSRVLVFILFLTIVSSVSAEEFSWQLSGSSHRSDLRGGSEIDITLLEATYFFQPVDDELGPYAITPFLSRSSRITATAQRIKAKRIVSFTSPIGGRRVFSESTDETAVYSIRGRHVWRSNGWYVGGGFQTYDLTDLESSSSTLDLEKDGYTLFGGKYLGPSTALELILNSTREIRDSAPVFTCVIFSVCMPDPFLVDSEFETEDVGVSVMHVGGGAGIRYSISGQIVARDTTFSSRTRLIAPLPAVPGIVAGGVVAGFASSSSPPTQREYSVAGEIFPTTRLGIRLGYTSFSNIGQLDDRYEVTTTWFFKRKIAAEFLVARTKFGFGVSGAARDEALVRLIGRL